MPRRLTFEEAWRLGDSLPQSLWLDPRTFKPSMSRTEWERLPRRRRALDRVLFRQPPKGYGEPRGGLFDGD